MKTFPNPNPQTVQSAQLGLQWLIIVRGGLLTLASHLFAFVSHSLEAPAVKCAIPSYSASPTFTIAVQSGKTGYLPSNPPQRERESPPHSHVLGSLTPSVGDQCCPPTRSLPHPPIAKLWGSHWRSATALATVPTAVKMLSSIPQQSLAPLNN